MASTRKRKKEFRRLKNEADTLLHDQREVIDQASKVVREASRQAGNYAREEVAPRVRETYDERVRPVVDSGISITRSAAHTTRDKIFDDVLPSVGNAVGSAIAALESAANSDTVKSATKSASRLRDQATKKGAKFAHEASKNVSKNVTKLGEKTGVVKPKSSGPGKYILIGIAVVAVAGIAYAAYQTLRADDDLWIDDEVDESDVETPVA